VAVKVTEFPVQIEFEGDATMLTDAVTLGLIVIGTFGETFPFPQLFFGVTLMFPPELPKLMVTLFVLSPAVIFAPVGRFHIYPVAPETNPTEYVAVLPLH
jgi:hypothetical protein